MRTRDQRQRGYSGKIMTQVHDNKYCGAKKRQGEGNCRRPAGWGTDHPGTGRCKLHGGKSTGAPGNTNRLEHGIYYDGVLSNEGEIYQSIVSSTEKGPLQQEIVMAKLQYWRITKRLALSEKTNHELELVGEDTEFEIFGDKIKTSKGKSVKKAVERTPLANILLGRITKMTTANRELVKGALGSQENPLITQHNHSFDAEADMKKRGIPVPGSFGNDVD